jgi:hypothetical protein
MNFNGGIDSNETVARGYRTAADDTECSQGINDNRAAETHVVLRWLRHDVPFILMLLLGLLGVIFKLSVIYWVIITPVFAVISVASGWRHFTSRAERFDLVIRLALDWCALLLSFYLLSNTGVHGVLNVNATSLTMMTLLALGTFVAGVQARVWQISAVGGILFAVVPSLAWLEQSPLLFTAVAVMAVALSGFAWWVSKGRLGGRANRS